MHSRYSPIRIVAAALIIIVSVTVHAVATFGGLVSLAYHPEENPYLGWLGRWATSSPGAAATVVTITAIVELVAAALVLNQNRHLLTSRKVRETVDGAPPVPNHGTVVVVFFAGTVDAPNRRQ